MPLKCCVPLCNGNYTKGPKVHTFSFPKEEHLFSKWLRAIRRDNFTPTTNHRVCHLHFQPEDIEWETSLFNEKTGITLTAKLKIPRLRKGAVPTKVPDGPSYMSKTTTTRESRSRRKRKKDEEIKVAMAKRIEDDMNYQRQNNFSSLDELESNEVITADSIFDCSSIYENGFIDEDSMGKASPIFHMEATSRPAIPTPPPKKQYKPGPASRYKPGPASKKRKRPPPPVIQEKTDDEFEVFGKSVAVQLRMLSLSRALRAQTKIQAILTEERILELETRTPSPEPLGPVITEVRGGAGDTRKMNGASSNASITSHDASSPSSSLANIPAEDTSNADEARASSSPLPLESSVAQSSTSFESSIAQSSASSESSVAQSSAPLDSSVAQSSASLESPVTQSTTVPLLPVKTEKESEVKSTLQEPDTAPPPKRTPSQEPDAAPPLKRTPSPESRVSRKTTPKLEEPKPSSKPNYHIIKAECEVITLDEDDPLEGFG